MVVLLGDFGPHRVLYWGTYRFGAAWAAGAQAQQPFDIQLLPDPVEDVFLACRADAQGNLRPNSVDRHERDGQPRLQGDEVDQVDRVGDGRQSAFFGGGSQQVLLRRLVPARWPAIRDEAWRSLLKARAIENQVFVAGCNGRGEEGGQSYVFDPMGALLLDSGQDPDRPAYSVELDLGLLRENHERMNYLDDAVMLKRLSLPPGFRRGRGIW